MALRHAILAGLLEGEASGYDLAKIFDSSVANFWMATPQQLYRELDRMAGDGLVAARVVRQERRPDKRLFTLTDAGRRALHDFTAAPPRPGAMRDELLVQLQAVDVGDADAVRRSVAERADASRARLARYERLRAVLLNGRDEDEHLARAERIGPYLTLLGGIAYEEANIRWAERVLDVLRRRSSSRT
ncbi:PadR family transcriptional regulator [Actinomadura algeriensis]|uniref:DNA-binding PadR family transcriptional regulator n=1 Tax=Actinomadura algeriensis TaxID=1679523 RepID=A0ABR9JNP3_9ACTN|nr:PadR family transcriptional regulator [Actinomadura algeriensis]MBE1532196.1 DNA-binding PadR family transcriptional regulator [Actinomadura algeriensis]